MVEVAREQFKDIMAMVKEQVGATLNELYEGVKRAARGVSDTMDRLTKSTMKYRDTVNWPVVQQTQNLGPHLTQLNPGLKMCEGCKG